MGARSTPDLPVEELSYQKKRLRNQKKRGRKNLQVGGISTRNSFAALGEEGGEDDDESESGEDDADVVEKNAVPGLLAVARGSAALVAYGVRRTVSLVAQFKANCQGEEQDLRRAKEASKKGRKEAHSIANKLRGSVHDKEIKKPKSSPEVDPDREQALEEFLDEKVTDLELEETRRDGADKPFDEEVEKLQNNSCLLYTSPSPRDRTRSRMPSSA